MDLPTTHGVIGGYRPLFGPGHGRARRFSVRSPYSAKVLPLLPPGCKPGALAVELAEPEYPRRDSNSDWQVRNLQVSPLAYEGAVPAARAERAPPPRHGGALPLSYAGLATPTGFEPVPSTVTRWRTGRLC